VRRLWWATVDASGRTLDTRKPGKTARRRTRDRDQAIAKALGTFVRDVRGPTTKPPDQAERGEQGA